jgi:NAD(P)-dependent dehydrogenase (short-subunit alcohol dehydrogenase family)
MTDLSGKHIFIAGGSRGIGAASAIAAAKAGAKVSITYRDRADKAKEVVEAIRALRGSAEAFKADIVDEKQVDAALEAASTKFGAPRGVVVSAGVFEHMRIEDMTEAFWRRLMDINLTGTMWTVKAAAKRMRAAGAGGAIVIYTSTAGQSGGGDGSAPYCVSKAAQIMFSRCMAHELAKDRIRCNCIAPAWTETDMAAASLEKLGRDKVAKSFPLGRIGKPDDIANATCFLLSDQAEFVTGTTMTVDGGLAMRG